MPKLGTNELERERLALQVFGEACALPPAERAACLDARCGEDPLLRRRVELLLGADQAPIAPLKGDVAAGAFLAAEVQRITQTADDDALAAPPAGRVPNHYRILRVLGEGGMATVYEAEQVHPRRLVAIKVIRGGLFSAELRRRFEYEAQVLAELQHPGIAQLYEAETRHDRLPDEDGIQCYLAMELVRGLPIDGYVESLKLKTDETLKLMLRVCDAVAYAHRQGVIHRDLKPANILVDAGGQPKVLDFGVARAIEGQGPAVTGLITGHGQLVGTLPYMSPEQVDVRLGAADTRCDVYALGVLLYKLLTGVMPIDTGDDGIAAAVERIRHQQPVKIGVHNRHLRGDLEVIVCKALEKEPDRRYRSVSALAEDLQRYLDGRAIEARADSALYVMRKIAWQHRRAATVVAIMLLLIAGLTIHSRWQSAAYRRQAEQAIRERDAAVAAREQAEADSQRLEAQLRDGRRSQ